MDDLRTLPGDYRPTDRTRLRRLAQRGHYDQETVHAILDAGLACHLAYTIDGRPYCTTTAYWREGERVYWHGSSGSRMLKAFRDGPEVCFNVALFDGLVLARSGFHSSFNYRSVTAYGRVEQVTDPAAKERALEAFFERLVPGRWAEARPITADELRQTGVFALPLEEVVAKVRTGPPGDDEEDYALPIWAGVVPLRRVLGEPEDDPRLLEGVARPAYLRRIAID